jgi:hypothetical protein
LVRLPDQLLVRLLDRLSDRTSVQTGKRQSRILRPPPCLRRRR